MFQHKTMPERPYVIALLHNRFLCGYGEGAQFNNGSLTGNCRVDQIWSDDGKSVTIGRETIPFEVKKQYQIVIPFGGSIRGVPATSLIMILDESNPYLRSLLNFTGSKEYVDMRDTVQRIQKQNQSLKLQLDQAISIKNELYQNVMNVVSESKIALRGAKTTTDVRESGGGLRNKIQETMLE
jgi:hypothetical protein